MFKIPVPKSNLAKPDKFIDDNFVIEVDSLKLKVLSTPGHTPGSVCFVDEKEKICFSGDTLFANSIGRMDFPGGSAEEMKKSLMKMDKLDGSIIIYPGHGEKAGLKDALQAAKKFLWRSKKNSFYSYMYVYDHVILG